MRHIFLFVFSCLLISCDQLFPLPPQSSVNATTPNTSRPNSGGDTLPQANTSLRPGEGYGVVKCLNSGDNDGLFTDRILKFLSTSNNPEQLKPSLGLVSCSSEGNTGMFFKAKILFKDSEGGSTGRLKLNQNSDTVLEVHKDSYITFYIQSGPTAAKIKPITIPVNAELTDTNINQVSSDNIQGKIIFSDDKGRVSLQGQIQSNGIFDGLISFTNTTSFDGYSSLFKGPLGAARVEACHIFNCGI